MTNKKDFFYDLDKTLPSSSYTERFKEELSNHLEDAVEENLQKGSNVAVAQEQALRNIGDADKISYSYIKNLLPHLLLFFYCQSLVIGILSSILCIGYFLLSISSFFFDQTGDDQGWVAWTLRAIIPFLIFLLFYTLSFNSLLKKFTTGLHFRLVSAITILPLLILSILVLIQTDPVGGIIYYRLFLPMGLVLSINYIALAFAYYIVTRGLINFPLLIARVLRYAIYTIIAVIELYLISSSILEYLNPQRSWQFLFLFPHQQINRCVETALGIGTLHVTMLNELWVYGILLTLIAILCLANLILYFYNKKNKGVMFPGFTLILLTYILFLFLIPPTQNSTLPVKWFRPAVEITKIIEKKETGPFYYWFLKSFKNKGGYNFFGINVIGNDFILSRGFGSENITTISDIKSINNYDIKNRILTESEIIDLQKYFSIPPPILEQDFTYQVTTATSTLLKSDTLSSAGFSYKSIPISPGYPYMLNQSGDLRYNAIPILSLDQVSTTMFSVTIDNQQKWALINLTEITEGGWNGRSGIYLISLP